MDLVSAAVIGLERLSYIGLKTRTTSFSKGLDLDSAMGNCLLADETVRKLIGTSVVSTPVAAVDMDSNTC